jgi:uncharacterized protein (DUF2249 family)
MTTAEEMLTRHRGAATGNLAGPPRTLAGEHALLLAQVTLRARDVLTATAGGRWPARELRAVAGYLRAEVLHHAEDEEWLLFPARHAPAAFARLGRDHVHLRAHVEALERAADGTGTHSRTEVATLTRDLLAEFKRHLAAEEAALTSARAPDQVPATTSPGTRQHGWYPLTEGPVIDLDALPADEMCDAAVDRLRRLRAGEQVELRSCRDTIEIWQRMDQLDSGSYGFYYLQDGPDEWRVQVTRRPPADDVRKVVTAE